MFLNLQDDLNSKLTMYLILQDILNPKTHPQGAVGLPNRVSGKASLPFLLSGFQPPLLVLLHPPLLCQHTTAQDIANLRDKI